MKDIYELEKAVDSYMERHGIELKHSKRNIDTNTYVVITTEYIFLEGRLIPMKNGKFRPKLKVNGKIASLYK